MQESTFDTPPEREPRGCLFISGIVLLTILATAVVTWFVITRYLFPQQFEPVNLSQKEEQVLEQKLARFEYAAGNAPAPANSEEDGLAPEKYSEIGASRQIELSERELNGLLANNTDLADRLVIDLSEDLASGKLLIPLDPDFPVMGGKTLKITAGMELAYRGEKPVVVLRGVSVMGVPLPSAWLGNMKNVDLITGIRCESGVLAVFCRGGRTRSRQRRQAGCATERIVCPLPVRSGNESRLSGPLKQLLYESPGQAPKHAPIVQPNRRKRFCPIGCEVVEGVCRIL